MKIEDKPVKAWPVWRLDHNGEPIERIAQADTREELAYTPRQDWHYGIFHKSKRVE